MSEWSEIILSKYKTPNIWAAKIQFYLFFTSISIKIQIPESESSIQNKSKNEFEFWINYFFKDGTYAAY